MTLKIIFSLILVLVVFLAYKVARAFIERDTLLAKFVPLGSILLMSFFLYLVYLA